MARAKQTARADARRRHREAARTGAAPTGVDAAESTPAAATTRSSRPQRPGIRAAFRESFRPLDLRGDIALLPRLIVHRSVLVPLAFTIGSAWLFVVIGPPVLAQPSDGAETASLPIEQIITTFLVQYFVSTPPVGAVFLAGFLAPRAGWLTGLIAGVAAASVITVLITSGRLGEIGSADVTGLITTAFLLSPTAGVVFGGAAAWYRRFLMLTNPNRNRVAQNSGKARRTSPRRR